MSIEKGVLKYDLIKSGCTLPKDVPKRDKDFGIWSEHKLIPYY